MENQRADVGRDGGSRLARPSTQLRTGTEINYSPRSTGHEQDWQPYPVDPFSAESADYTYIHTTVRIIGVRKGRRTKIGP